MLLAHIVNIVSRRRKVPQFKRGSMSFVAAMPDPGAPQLSPSFRMSLNMNNLWNMRKLKLLHVLVGKNKAKKNVLKWWRWNPKSSFPFLFSPLLVPSKVTSERP